MSYIKSIIIAGAVICGYGLALACSNYSGTQFPDLKECNGSPCGYRKVTPACFYCGTYSAGANCMPSPGSDYTAMIQYYINGTCVNGYCQGGEPDPDEPTEYLGCYYLISPQCGG